MFIFRPDAVGDKKILHVDVHETSAPEPFLQLDPGTHLAAGRLECVKNFIVISLEGGAVKAAIL